MPLLERLYVPSAEALPLDPDDAVLYCDRVLAEGPEEPRPLLAVARDVERITTQQVVRNLGNPLSRRMPDAPDAATLLSTEITHTRRLHSRNTAPNTLRSAGQYTKVLPSTSATTCTGTPATLTLSFHPGSVG